MPLPLAIISFSFWPDAVFTVSLIEVAFMIESCTSPKPKPPFFEPASSPAATIVGSPFGFCLRSVSWMISRVGVTADDDELARHEARLRADAHPVERLAVLEQRLQWRATASP